MRITGWVASGVVAVALALMGSAKFFLYEAEVAAFARWGYPAWFVLVVGAGELTVAGTVLWARTASYAALLGAALMMGAVATHARVPEVGLIPLASLIGGLCLLIAQLQWKQRWRPLRP